MHSSPNERASIVLHSLGGERWFGADAIADRTLNVGVEAREGYSAAVIGVSPDPRISMADHLVAILSETRPLGRTRLMIENRSGRPLEKKDFPFAMSRLMDSINVRHIAVVQPPYAGPAWTRFDIAFGRDFSVAVRKFSETTEALGWLCPN